LVLPLLRSRFEHCEQWILPEQKDFGTVECDQHVSENDICCQVARRKISAGTRSNLGRDTILGLDKAYAKPSVGFWDFLGSRLNVPGQRAVPPLPALRRCCGHAA
jgi:hypothetical protein